MAPGFPRARRQPQRKKGRRALQPRGEATLPSPDTQDPRLADVLPPRRISTLGRANAVGLAVKRDSPVAPTMRGVDARTRTAFRHTPRCTTPRNRMLGP